VNAVGLVDCAAGAPSASSPDGLRAGGGSAFFSCGLGCGGAAFAADAAAFAVACTGCAAAGAVFTSTESHPVDLLESDGLLDSRRLSLAALRSDAPLSDAAVAAWPDPWCAGLLRGLLVLRGLLALRPSPPIGARFGLSTSHARASLLRACRT